MIPLTLTFHLSIDGPMDNALASHLGIPGSIPGFGNGTLSKKAKSLFISKEILKAEISKIGPPYDMDFVEL